MDSTSLELGRQVLRQEAAALLNLSVALGSEFDEAVHWIFSCKSRTLTCGVGKSGHIARKVAGTFSSTGTPSAFLHASDAVHGDLGMVAEGDVVLLFSQSGETDEIVRLFPSFRSQKSKTILVTSRADSSAGRLADLVLDLGITEEACPHNLAPTTSTTAMLGLSDALALAVMNLRGFSKEDFARFHPSGSLGKRLLLTVEDAMRGLSDIALCSKTDSLIDVTKAITQAGVGAACITDTYGTLIGFISDGDLRRCMASATNFNQIAETIMNTKVVTIEPDMLAIEALEVFQNLPRKLGELPVVSRDKLVGLLMLKDLLRSGIV